MKVVLRLANLLMAAVLILWPAPYLMANCQAGAPCAGASVAGSAQMASRSCCCGVLASYCEEATACGIGHACTGEPALTGAVEAFSVAHIGFASARAARLDADFFNVSLPPGGGPPAAISTRSFIALHVLLI